MKPKCDECSNEATVHVCKVCDDKYEKSIGWFVQKVAKLREEIKELKRKLEFHIS